MKPSEVLDINRVEIRRIVSNHNATNPKVFGSVIYGKDTDGSDLDIIVEPTSNMTLFDLGAIRYELQVLLGVSVDVLTPNALPENFRSQVLARQSLSKFKRTNFSTVPLYSSYLSNKTTADHSFSAGF